MRNALMKNKLCVSVKSAAEMLGVSRTTVYTQIRSNCIHHIKLGRRILIPLKELEWWVHEKSIQCASDSAQTEKAN